MNVKAFIEAMDYPILKDWIERDANADYEMGLMLIKTQHFKDWYQSHPHGTMEQYLVYRNQQVTAYYNSPQYRLQMLQEQIEDLNSNITELKEEVQAKNDEIDDLKESLNQAKTSVWALGFVSICLLLFLLRKYFTYLFEKKSH